jgi:hypothetical protein
MYNILSIGKPSLCVMPCSLCLQRRSAGLVVVYCNERALNSFLQEFLFAAKVVVIHTKM